jgi:hypothetical protein
MCRGAWQYTCTSQRGIGRVLDSLSATFLLCVLLVAVCGVRAVAQTAESSGATDSSQQAVPSGISEEFLNFAASSSALGRRDEGLQHYFDAARKYESIITEAAKSNSTDTTAFNMMKAAAYMDAARTRFYYGATLDKSATLYESNRALISDWLAGAQSELDRSHDKRKIASLNILGWSCDSAKLSAQSYYLQGMLNNTTSDLDKSIDLYKYVGQCEPATKSQVDGLTAYIAGVRANLAHSPLSSSEIMKDISATLHLFGMEGDAVSLVVQRVYQTHQVRQAPPPIAVR